MSRTDLSGQSHVQTGSWNILTLLGLFLPFIGSYFVTIFADYHADVLARFSLIGASLPSCIAIGSRLEIPKAVRISAVPLLLSMGFCVLNPWIGMVAGYFVLGISLYLGNIRLSRIPIILTSLIAFGLLQYYALTNAVISALAANIFIPGIQILTLAWMFISMIIHRSALFFELIKDGRWPRVMFFFLNYLAGWTYVHHDAWDDVWGTILKHAIILIAIAAVAWHAIVINNIEDQKIDQISNPNRPLVRQLIHPVTYEKTGWAALILGLLLASTVSCMSGLFLFLCALGYWLYSARPFRIKRIPVISKLFIGFNIWCMWLMGMQAPGIGIKEIPLFVHLYAFIGVGVTSNFIDLKDLIGDRAAGIRTLPVLLGTRTTLVIVILATVVSYGIMLQEVQGNVWKFLAIGNMIVQISGYLFPPTRDHVPFIAMNLGMVGFILSLYFPF